MISLPSQNYFWINKLSFYDFHMNWIFINYLLKYSKLINCCANLEHIIIYSMINLIHFYLTLKISLDSLLVLFLYRGYYSILLHLKILYFSKNFVKIIKRLVALSSFMLCFLDFFSDCCVLDSFDLNFLDLFLRFKQIQLQIKFWLFKERMYSDSFFQRGLYYHINYF